MAHRHHAKDKLSSSQEIRIHAGKKRESLIACALHAVYVPDPTGAQYAKSESL